MAVPTATEQESRLPRARPACPSGDRARCALTPASGQAENFRVLKKHDSLLHHLEDLRQNTSDGLLGITYSNQDRLFVGYPE